MYILNNMENLKDIPFTDKNPVLVDLKDAAELMEMSYDEQVAYDRSLKRMWDYDAGLWSAKEEGKAEGKLSMATKLKSLGVDIDTIVQASGLSKEEIEKL